MDDASDHYSFIAHQYDRLLGPFLDGLRRAGLDLCPPAPGWKVLDVGSGTGAQLELYQREGCTVAGIEASPALAPAHGFTVERARVKTGGTFGVYLLARSAR